MTRIVTLAALALSAACGAGSVDHRGRDSTAADQNQLSSLEARGDSIDAVSDRLAASISRRDAAGAADRVPTDSSVVYVSDGVPIRGFEYLDVLQRFYSTVDSIDFNWTYKEIVFPTPQTAVVTGWASIRMRRNATGWSDDRAIFTLVYRLDDTGFWHYVTSQKTSLPHGPRDNGSAGPK